MKFNTTLKKLIQEEIKNYYDEFGYPSDESIDESDKLFDVLMNIKHNNLLDETNQELFKKIILGLKNNETLDDMLIETFIKTTQKKIITLINKLSLLDQELDLLLVHPLKDEDITF